MNPRPASALLMVVGVLAMLSIAISTFVTLSRVNLSAATARNYVARTDIAANGVLRQVRRILADDLRDDQEGFDHPGWDPWLASITNDGGHWKYVSRIDIPDVPSGDPGNTAVTPAIPPGRQRMPIPVPAIASNPNDPNANSFNPPPALDFNRDNYVDTDGDNITDALLLPLATNSELPDRTRMYYAVRIIDNAHYNSRQHLKWHQWADQTNATNSPADNTIGQVDWRPDRPRLPHVNLRGARNWIERQVAGFNDNPDRAPSMTAADPQGGSGYDFDTAFDPWLGTDDNTAVVDPSFTRPPFTLEDDLALRTFLTDPATCKYLQLWPMTLGTQIIGSSGFVMNQRRLVSSVTRTLNFAWETPVPGLGRQFVSKADLRKLTEAFDPSLPEAANQTRLLPFLEAMFGAMKTRNILQNDVKRAQYLANLFEYLCPPNPQTPGVYNPIVYRGRVGLTRQPYITEFLREGDATATATATGRVNWNGRLGVELYNPHPAPISLEGYRLVLESALPEPNPPFGGRLAYTNTAIVRASVEVSLPGSVSLPAFGYAFFSTDYSNAFALPAQCRQLGPRIVARLVRNVASVGDVVFDVADTRYVGLNNNGLDFRDWDSPQNASEASVFYAAVNNAWTLTNPLLLPVRGQVGRRSGVYRPMGNPANSGAEYPAYMTAEWLGYAVRDISTTNLDNTGYLGSANQPNARQGDPDFGSLPVRTGGVPFIFGYAVSLPKRARLAHAGELTRVLTVGNSVERAASEWFADASYISRHNAISPRAPTPEATAPVVPWGRSDNWTAWLNGERWVRFDAYDPNPDNLGRSHANARLFDLVSGYHTPSGNGVPFGVLVMSPDDTVREFPVGLSAADFAAAVAGGGGTVTSLDDSSEDDADTNADGQFRPAFREGLVNINTAPAQMIQNLVFPRAQFTANTVNNGNNTFVANNLVSYTMGIGNAFERLSDVILWARYASPTQAHFNNDSGTSFPPNVLQYWFNRQWDIGINRDGQNNPRNSFRHNAPDLHDTFRQSYPGLLDELYTPTPTFGTAVPFRRMAYINDMADRDSIWAANTNVLTTRSDVFTVYILIKLVRLNPNNAAAVQDLGTTRLVAIVDRTNCNPVLPMTIAGPRLPRVLVQQFME